MPRVVIDTSVWLSGIFWRGAPHRVLQAWRAGDCDVVISAETLAELERTLRAKVAEFGADPGLAAEWLTLISQEAIWVEPRERVHACRDAADDKLLEAALAGRAAFLVSGDQDLLVLGRFRGLAILTPAQFLDRLRQTS